MDLTTVATFRDADDALTLAPGETWLAGGTWLFSEPQPGTTGLVDLTALDWSTWERGTDLLTIGATCTIAELVERAEDAKDLPALAIVRPAAESLVMSSKIWSAATVGGNVCLALPAGAMTSWLAGLGAVAVVRGPSGTRREPVADLVRGVRATSLGHGEVVRAFELDLAVLAAPAVLRRFALTEMGRSGGVVVGRPADAGSVLTVTGATDRPRVVRDEQGLADLEWYDDPHGAPDWRAAQTLRCAREVVAELAGVA